MQRNPFLFFFVLNILFLAINFASNRLYNFYFPTDKLSPIDAFKLLPRRGKQFSTGNAGGIRLSN